MQRKSSASYQCPMARSVDVIGDWGSLMILRQAFGGTTRFDDFQKELEMSRNLLTARLKNSSPLAFSNAGPSPRKRGGTSMF